MIIRHAMLIGSPKPSQADAFDKHMAGPVLQTMQAYPKIVKVELLKTISEDADIYMQFNSYYRNEEDMVAALNSPIRAKVRDLTLKGMDLFEGKILHAESKRIGT